jgi:hypothetical protein
MRQQPCQPHRMLALGTEERIKPADLVDINPA